MGPVICPLSRQRATDLNKENYFVKTRATWVKIRTGFMRLTLMKMGSDESQDAAQKRDNPPNGL